MDAVFYGKIKVQISEEDYAYLCKNRFNGEKPSQEELCSEFVTGTGITPNKPHLWSQASQKFAEYINDLREIQTLDINKAARCLLTEEEKYET